jgi:hypothetical protein
MKKLGLIIILLFSVKAFAQYPFEKYPVMKYTKVPFAVSQNEKDSSFTAIGTYKNYILKLHAFSTGDSSQISISYKDKLVQVFNSDAVDLITVHNPIYIGDIDGNGLADFKLDFFNNGAGLAGSLERKVYLFNNGKNHFKMISFMDFFDNVERDFNHDGNFEIIGQHLLRYKGHSYWLFDLYNYRNGKFKNVSQKYNYPIAIQYLERDNHQATHKNLKKILG